MPKPLSMPEWDQQVAPILHRITSNASACATRARYITAEVAVLRMRPSWLTKAQAELAQAKAEIAEAYSQIILAEELYNKLPIEDANEA